IGRPGHDAPLAALASLLMRRIAMPPIVPLTGPQTSAALVEPANFTRPRGPVVPSFAISDTDFSAHPPAVHAAGSPRAQAAHRVSSHSPSGSALLTASLPTYV